MKIKLIPGWKQWIDQPVKLLNHCPWVLYILSCDYFFFLTRGLAWVPKRENLYRKNFSIYYFQGHFQVGLIFIPIYRAELREKCQYNSCWYHWSLYDLFIQLLSFGLLHIWCKIYHLHFIIDCCWLNLIKWPYHLVDLTDLSS